jgi:NAD(P)-dependent dehydrogenase (short-subunit alcohol dehydrogenase family)
VTPSHRVSETLFDRVVAVNLEGTFFGCKHALPALRRRGGGTIVNNSSVSAFANVGGNVAYAASKGAVMSLTRALAIETAGERFRVNAICPGVIDTAMNVRNRQRAPDPAEVGARAVRRRSQPWGPVRPGTDCAAAVRRGTAAGCRRTAPSAARSPARPYWPSGR